MPSPERGHDPLCNRSGSVLPSCGRTAGGYRHSTFPEREISKEKDVVVDEIHAYADSPSDHIFDLFDELIFPDHPLGRNILGTPKSVRSFSRSQLLAFTARLYRTDRIVLATAGPMSGEKVERIWSALWTTACLEASTLGRKGAGAHKAVHAQRETAQSQTHCILGNRAFGGEEDHSLAFHLLNNILGGPTMNNRLNLRIRERFDRPITWSRSTRPIPTWGPGAYT